MTNLDNNYISPSGVSFLPTAFKYGGVAGVLLIALGLILHLTGMNDYSNPGGVASWIQTFLYFVVWIGSITLAMRYHRDNELGGYMSFGRGFGVGIVAALVMGIIGGIWAYIFSTFIAPEMAEMIREATMENLTEEQAAGAGGIMEVWTSPTGIVLSNIVGSLVGGAVLSLIIAAIMKKDAPNA